MRLDLFLRNTGLVKQRSLAAQACEHGAILVDGKPGRPGQRVRLGQKVTLLWPTRLLEVEILMLAEKPVPRAERERCYRVLREERREEGAA